MLSFCVCVISLFAILNAGDCNVFKWDGAFMIAPDVCVNSRQNGKEYSEIWECVQDNNQWNIEYKEYSNTECSGDLTQTTTYKSGSGVAIVCDKNGDDCWTKWREYINRNGANDGTCSDVQTETDDYRTYPMVINDCDSTYFGESSQSLKWRCKSDVDFDKQYLQAVFWFNDGQCSGGSNFAKSYYFCDSEYSTSMEKDYQVIGGCPLHQDEAITISLTINVVFTVLSLIFYA